MKFFSEHGPKRIVYTLYMSFQGRSKILSCGAEIKEEIPILCMFKGGSPLTKCLQ